MVQQKEEAINIARYLKTGIPESERSIEITRVAEEFGKDNDIVEVANYYFRYRPRKRKEPIREMGYTEGGQQYETNGSYADYLNSTIDPSYYSEEHFKASENLEIRAKASGALHDSLVLWFYNWLTIDVIYEHSFDIEFGGTSGLSYLTVNPEHILPMTKAALDSRALMGDPEIELEKNIHHEQYKLLEEIRAIDKSNVKKLLNLARKESVKIRLKEV